MPRSKKKPKTTPTVASDGTVATNRRARFEYEILDQFEAGLVLKGSEIKSLRQGKIDISSAYVRIRNGEAWLIGSHIAPYEAAGIYGQHEPARERKLLLNRREIDRLSAQVERAGLTIVVLRVFITRGIAKAAIALARGKRQIDRRDTIRRREQERDIARAMHRTAP